MKLTDERIIIRLSRRIKKLEADMKLANERIRVLEDRPNTTVIWPREVPATPPPPAPLNPCPMPYVVDLPLGSFEVDYRQPSHVTINGQTIEPTKGQTREYSQA